MSNVVQLPAPRCPDCGSVWPSMHRGERCPGCLLSVEELEAAAAFLDMLKR